MRKEEKNKKYIEKVGSHHHGMIITGVLFFFLFLYDPSLLLARPVVLCVPTLTVSPPLAVAAAADFDRPLK